MVGWRLLALSSRYAGCNPITSLSVNCPRYRIGRGVRSDSEFFRSAGVDVPLVVDKGNMRWLKASPIVVAVGALVLCLSSGLRAQTKTQQGDSGQRAGEQTRQAPDIAKQREQILTSIETEPAVAASDQRWNCATGAEPQRVREARVAGRDFVPDASESCPAVVRRELRDGRVMELYERIAQLGGGKMSADEVLAAVQKAALNNDPQVPIGGGKAIPTSNALALDAGYMTGLMNKAVTMQNLGLPPDSAANATKIKDTAEACLDGKNAKPPTASACFTAGAVKAVMDRRVAASK